MPEDLNQTLADASLSKLHDIITPDAIGFFPLASAWYSVILLCLALGFHVAFRYYKQYEKMQYKREALELLETLKKTAETGTDKEMIVALLSLAKRVGMTAYGRENIATLSPDAWWEFVQEHSKAQISSALVGKIERLLYQDETDFSETDVKELFDLVTMWVKSHKVLKDV